MLSAEDTRGFKEGGHPHPVALLLETFLPSTDPTGESGLFSFFFFKREITLVHSFAFLVYSN